MSSEPLSSPWRKGFDQLPIIDGQLFDLGGQTLEALAASGHSFGRASLLFREGAILFSDDSREPSPLIMMKDRETGRYTLAVLEEYDQDPQKLLNRENAS